jgi:hypothetical protein
MVMFMNFSTRRHDAMSPRVEIGQNQISRNAILLICNKMSEKQYFLSIPQKNEMDAT